MTDPQALPLHLQQAWPVYRRLVGYLKPWWWAIGLSVIGYALNSGTELAIAKLIRYVIDAVQVRDQSAMNLFPVLIVGLFVARGLGTFLGGYYMAVVARNLVYRLRVQVFDRILTLPASYFLKNSGAHVASRMMYDVEQVTAAATEGLKTILRDGMTVVALLGYLVYTNWRLSLVLVVIAPVIGFLVRKAGRRMRALSHRVQNSMGDVNHIVTETVQGFTVVKDYGGQGYEHSRFQQASKNNLRQGLKMVITSNINTPAVQLIMASGMALVVWLALRPTVLGHTTPGEFISYITAAGLLSKPVRALTDVNDKFQRGVAAAQAVFALIDTPAESDRGVLSPMLTGAIELDRLSVRYPDGTLALDEISLDVKAGQTVALVGRSGSGKTTLINTLLRHVEATGGTIRLDGVEQQAMSLASLRRQIASVNQQVMLFNAPVRDNIAYGELGRASLEHIKAAARAAYADGFIEKLPQGYDTLLGPQGLSLSGGQRQRLAIARALLKDAPILILDEATSALDNESEHFIQQALDEAMRNRTVLVIAHRLSTIEHADVIVVMDQGRIVEQGTHSELLARHGLYTQLHQRDFSQGLIGDSQGPYSQGPSCDNQGFGHDAVQESVSAVSQERGGEIGPRIQPMETGF